MSPAGIATGTAEFVPIPRTKQMQEDREAKVI